MVAARDLTRRPPRDPEEPDLNADPADQLRLLELQGLDSTIARLAHRRGTLPEIAELAALDAELQRLADEGTLAETSVRDLARAQTKLDADIDVVRQRKSRDQTRLDSGTVSSSKELLDLQAEIESLNRRQGVLEDEELEIMQSREDAETTLTSLQERTSAVAQDRSAVALRRTATEAEIDTESTEAGAVRAQLAPTLPADLVALYDKVRAGNGGVGAARLFRKRCEGCHIELGAAELREVKAADPATVVRCENCGRILVRTDESGL